MSGLHGALKRHPIVRLANTPRSLVALVIGSWLFAGLLFAAVEGEHWGDGLYWSVTTLSATGYGDVTPDTWAGKIVAGLKMVWSLFFLLPAAIFHVSDAIIVDRDKEEAKRHDNEQTALIRRLALHLGCDLDTDGDGIPDCVDDDPGVPTLPEVEMTRGTFVEMQTALAEARRAQAAGDTEGVTAAMRRYEAAGQDVKVGPLRVRLDEIVAEHEGSDRP